MEAKVFDWDKAAWMIRAKKPSDSVQAGLQGDWGNTGGRIYADGKPVPEGETYVYLASTWATPSIWIDGETTDCWVPDDTTDWDRATYWPESALKILNGEEE